MSSSSIAPRSAPAAVRPRARHALRWVAALVVALVLHGLTMQWFGQHGINALAPPERVPVQIALLKPERVELTVSNQTMPAAHRAAPHMPMHEPPDAHTLSAVATTTSRPQPATNTTPDATASASAPVAVSGTATGKVSSAGDSGNSNITARTSAPHGVKFSVPPSGDLQYDTFYNNNRNALGTIHWQFDGQHYDMSLSFMVPFIGRFGWESRGHVDAFGLAPEQYIERRGHRPENFTVFNRENRQIVFTRTSTSLALSDGAQDRLSVIMQLVSLVRGNPDAYRTGVTREFYVADNDSGEIWPVITVGDDSVQTDRGFVSARHFTRMPRHAGDKRRIDVWLAPSLGWLPVRVLQTESNGNEMELVWRGPLKLTVTDATDHADDTDAGDARASDAPTGSAPDFSP